MPIEEFAAKQNYAVSPSLPKHLDHQPIYAMPYKQFDGWRNGETDTRYLSIGISQWCANEVSLKIMRYKDQWSRQSEELPLHRVIDSSIFLAKVLLDRDEQSVEIERSLFTNQPEGFRIEEEPVADQDKDQFDKFLSDHEKALRGRFNKLYQMLNSLKAQGKL
ncbi:hypothetical protein IFR08_16950 [Pseudomonas fluorescens]|uniref:DUF6530 family protein n=1 Tax=Pseudomonas TaxID=286 RepID=UPI000811F489|nr:MULTISPECIES: DUF6530 family protein [Pseudomonas]MBD8099401.1 hypothetical protein [Pseudomonas fluorescens]MBD8775430.1 hypothetical protein [Pseudomonas fluorescens]MBD8781466.1 hypothetical protein [Pseudomonas fluorescens]MBD8794612.1 hypothetical protein [Pseudomonas fluorescens]TKK27330.1 hypothetical protein PspCFBP13528_22075 [Pseudomonas sp. CFBP13528]